MYFTYNLLISQLAYYTYNFFNWYPVLFFASAMVTVKFSVPCLCLSVSVSLTYINVYVHDTYRSECNLYKYILYFFKLASAGCLYFLLTQP